MKHTLTKNPVRWIETNALFLTEMNKKMKLSVTIVLLSIASYAFAQSPNRDSRSTKIDENEKKRLENQFKSLNTFYINDDGLVVYQTQSSSTTQKEEETPADTTSHTTSTPQNVKTEESESNYLIKDDSEDTKITPIEKPLSTRIVSPAEPIRTEATTQEKAPVRSSIIRKEALKPTEVLSHKESASNNATETNTEVGTRSTTIKNSPITLANEEQADNVTVTKVNTNNNQISKEANKTAQTKTTSKKTSVFNKKYTPQYKTMEEAALAVEALLEDLRKEQAQTTSAGSMSSRLSGGAGRATLRKKPATNPSYANNNSDNTTTNITNVVDEETSEFGHEPTYFINGKEVDKIEVNRLRKKEIINKEVRTRNTVSGNPNGEVWYEVKYDN
ncbi:hypothetical protein G7050_08745 [Dysgonomonas sp. HDW5A]|uniref:hypothetical protein n=1 Tax=Dysgonomonas sp. HDW5A TaxID=2714926 RepID=UPI001409718C|nr:hypothetical protein [Dysgonomonas sp. HDW5A]QIK59910.1 hypothetical protein G7050_08745 [Dysgonomonas sp. HDW5A]